MSLIRLRFVVCLLLIPILLALSTGGGAEAQQNPESEPVYIVQPGDTLWGIARTFNVSLNDLVQKNNIADPAQLAAGKNLVIPGYEGLQGVLVIDAVPYGESVSSLSRRTQVPVADLVRLNRWTTPDNAAAGSTLITLDRSEEALSNTGERATLRKGLSIFELALSRSTNQWAVVNGNQIRGVREALPGSVYYLPGMSVPGPSALPGEIETIVLTPPSAIQGKTLEIQVTSSEVMSMEGSLGDQPLHFFPFENGFVAMQGVHALQEPGYYPSVIAGRLNDDTWFEFSQHIYIADGGYPYDPPLVVNSETIDVENTQPEDFEWFAIVEPVTEERLWSGVFTAPVPEPLKDCFPSLFGNRRSYNGSAYQYFHTGLDFCGSVGVEIYAPAAGRVIYTESLVVRGNATVIDHGWGVYTAYAHQSEILVSAGDWVERGQLIGLVGSTGRVTGPHLHWEVIVGGVQVDPLDWLRNEYP